jgi:hypothetical protein
VTLDITTGRITFSTTNLTDEVFQIRVQTKSSPYFYIPVKLWIRSKNDFIFNAPPAFKKEFGYTVYFTVDFTEKDPEPVEYHTFKWDITQQFDDYD